MKRLKIIIFPILIIILLLIIPSKQAGAYSAYIDKEKVNSIEIGIGPGNHAEIDSFYKKKNAVYSFYTSNRKIVEVNKSTGELKGIKTGKAIITCKETISGKTTVFGTCEIIVKDIVIEKEPYSIAIGDEYLISDRMYYRNPDATYQYTSSKPSVATVSKNGTAKGIKAGSTIITIKEVLKGKTRTVGTVTIKVEAATIVKDLGRYDIGASSEGFFILTSDQKLHISSFIKYSISDAVYQFVSGDETIVKVEKRGNDTYIVPLNAGVASLTIKETFQGKTRTVGTVCTAVDLRRYLEINKQYLVSTDTSYVTVSEGVEGSVESLLSVKDFKKYYVDFNNLEIKYTSNKEDIIEIDEKTGVFKAIKPGSATITASFPGSDVVIIVNVAKKGTLGKTEEKGNTAIEEINTLVKTEVTKSNVSDLWDEISNLNHSIGYFPDMDWQEEEPYLYRVNGDNNYWAIPNFYKLEEFSRKVVEVLKKEADELLVKQEIVSVSNIKKDSITIEFKYPLTKNFYTYFKAISVEGSAYEAMLACYLIESKNLNNNYGLLITKFDANKIVLSLSKDLKKGTYTLICSDEVCKKPFEFIYK